MGSGFLFFLSICLSFLLFRSILLCSNSGLLLVSFGLLNIISKNRSFCKIWTQIVRAQVILPLDPRSPSSFVYKSSSTYVFLLASPSQDVFLLPYIPWIDQGGSITSCYVTLRSVWWPHHFKLPNYVFLTIIGCILLLFKCSSCLL